MSKFRPIEGEFDPLGDLQVLVGRLQQQVRLGLDQQEDAAGMCVLGQGLEDLDEQVDRLLARLSGRQRTARLGGDVRRAELGAEREGAAGVIDADLAVMRVGLDERGVPVGLAMIGDRVHHERVDVREPQPGSFHRREDRALLPFEQARRPGVGDVGEELQPRVADPGDPLRGLVEGVFQVGVGAEGELHGSLSRGR